MTQKELAKMLNVSRSTVARALNNSGYVEENLKRRILELAEQTGYRSNFMAKNLASNKKLRIHSFIVEAYNPEFYKEHCIGIKKAVDEFSYYDIKTSYTKLDVLYPEKHWEIIQDKLKDNDINAVIINTISDERISDIIDKFSKKGIIFVTVGMEQKSENVALHVGNDFVKRGRLSAELINKFMCSGGKIIVLKSELPYMSAVEQYKGFMEKVKSYPNIEIVEEIAGTGDLTNLYVRTKEIMSQQEIVGVYSSLDINQAIKAALELDVKLPIFISNDLSIQTANFLRNGILKCILYQQTMRQYVWATRAIIRQFFGEEDIKRKRVIIDSKVLFEESMDIQYTGIDGSETEIDNNFIYALYNQQEW